MRKLNSIIFIVLSIAALTGCKDKHIETRRFVANVPVYNSYEQMRSGFNVAEPRELQNPGKIFVYGNYLFVNEKFKGVHVINNQNPFNPVFLSFISIPGNVDIEVKGGYMYADSYVDLLVIDIKNPEIATVKGRVKDVFEYAIPEYDEAYPLARIQPSNGVIVGWNVMEIEESCVNEDCNTYRFNDNGMLVSEGSGGFGASGGSNIRNTLSASGGSMSRFSIKNNCLYTISSTEEITVFDISNTSSPSVGNKVRVNTFASIETLFQYENNLFVGSQNGMYIYDISNVCEANYVSDFQHSTSCDPVVVSGEYAYFTMRSGGRCGGWRNTLNVVNVSTISQPTFVTSINLNNPYGLGIDAEKNTLFVCDGGSGIKVFDTADPRNIASNQLKTVNGLDAYDVIPLHGILFVSGKTGIYQYDYSDVKNIKLISSIAIRG